MAGELLPALAPRCDAPWPAVRSPAARRRASGQAGHRYRPGAPPRSARPPGNGAEIGRSARKRSLRRNAAAGMLVLLVGLFHAWTGLEVGRLGYALSDARALTERLDQELHELAVEYAAETAPRRLEQLAGRRLRLRPPAPGQVMVLP